MSKQPKTTRPTDADLKGNPMIGSSRGVNAAGATPDELEADQGATTFEGDTENGANPQGGIDKSAAQGRQVSSRPKPRNPSGPTG